MIPNITAEGKLLELLITDLWPIKVNFPFTHTGAQLGKMCHGIPYMAGNQYSSLA